jgi:hypothetical protein
MVTQYPDIIVLTIKPDPVQTNGVYSAATGVSSNVLTFNCRAEVNGLARKIPGKDGALIDYSYDCYLPKMVEVIPVGTGYVLNSIIEGKIKRHSNGQLNSRLWL